MICIIKVMQLFLRGLRPRVSLFTLPKFHFANLIQLLKKKISPMKELANRAGNRKRSTGVYAHLNFDIQFSPQSSILLRVYPQQLYHPPQNRLATLPVSLSILACTQVIWPCLPGRKTC